jgi:hypothetical protein
MAFIGCLVIHEPSALIMSLYVWECVLVKDYARVGASNAAASLTVLSKVQQEAAHASKGECLQFNWLAVSFLPSNTHC